MVLEAKFTNQGADNPGKRQLLCVVRFFCCLFAMSVVLFQWFCGIFPGCLLFCFLLNRDEPPFIAFLPAQSCNFLIETFLLVCK